MAGAEVVCPGLEGGKNAVTEARLFGGPVQGGDPASRGKAALEIMPHPSWWCLEWSFGGVSNRPSVDGAGRNSSSKAGRGMDCVRWAARRSGTAG